MKRRWLLSALVVAASVLAGSAQTQPTQPQNTENSIPTFKTETRLVVVDTVVTDKKGNYIRDLSQKDFKVWEDNKEQPIKSFSVETEASTAPDRRHYLVLFFDDSTMELADQSRARDAALKFLDANTGSDRYIAVADFGGTLRIAQNFTTDAARLKEVVRGLKFSSVSPGGVSTASSWGNDRGNAATGKCRSRLRGANSAAGAAQSGKSVGDRAGTQDRGHALSGIPPGSSRS
jgi:VWFA-related protein